MEGLVNTVTAERAKRWIPESFQVFKKDGFGFFLLFLVVILAGALLSLIPVLGTLLNFLLSPVLQGGVYNTIKNFEQTQEINFSDLLYGFKKNTKDLMVLALLSILLFLLPLALLGAAYFILKDNTLALILVCAIVGTISIFLYLISFMFAPALVLLNNLKPMEALKLSAEGCMANWWPLTVYSLILILFVFLALLPLGLGLLVLMPLLQIVHYKIFSEFFNFSTISSNPSAQPLP